MEQEEELLKIKYAAESLPVIRRNSKNIGAIIKEYTVTELPTGSIIVTRAYGHIVGYHSNDMHTHGSLLFWCSTDGEDRFSLFYEPGKTRPMTVELSTILTNFSCNTIIANYPDVIKDQEFAHRPLDKFLFHPRFLEVVKSIILRFPLMFLFNDCEYSFRHKYAPLVYPAFKSYHNNPYDYYSELEDHNSQLLEYSIRNPRLTNFSCVDTLSTYITILHDELFVKLTPQELSEGKSPAQKLQIENVTEFDIARLVNPKSPIFNFFNNTPEKLVRGKFKVERMLDIQAGIFILPYIVTIILFFLVSTGLFWRVKFMS